jgi:hypothetical protein
MNAFQQCQQFQSFKSLRKTPRLDVKRHNIAQAQEQKFSVVSDTRDRSIQPCFTAKLNVVSVGSNSGNRLEHGLNGAERLERRNAIELLIRSLGSEIIYG